MLATFFLLTGLAIVGFPGTVGFAGIELIVEGAVEVFPYVGCIGRDRGGFERHRNSAGIFPFVHRHRVSNDVFDGSPLAREGCRFGDQCILIIGGGIIPQPGVQSRYHAAKEIMSRREVISRLIPHVVG